MPLIIDGHNLLWSIQKASEEDASVDAVRLSHVVGRYLKLIADRGEIVFDGTGPPDKGRFENIADLEVFFAGLSTDADTVIEDKIKASSAPKRLTVVSSDRRVRKAAMARKATSVKSEIFWTNLCRRLARPRGVKEPSGKRLGLSEGETDQWLKVFGLEE